LVDRSEGHPDQGQHAEEEVEREFWMLLLWFLETVNHLFFLCPIAKVIWGLMDLCFGVKTRPTNYDQFWLWIKKALSGGGGGASLYFGHCRVMLGNMEG
jgi:hypothetical protein